jgi:hypothetical protein
VHARVGERVAREALCLANSAEGATARPRTGAAQHAMAREAASGARERVAGTSHIEPGSGRVLDRHAPTPGLLAALGCARHAKHRVAMRLSRARVAALRAEPVAPWPLRRGSRNAGGKRRGRGDRSQGLLTGGHRGRVGLVLRRGCGRCRGELATEAGYEVTAEGVGETTSKVPARGWSCRGTSSHAEANSPGAHDEQR